jgi:hypothetical protein
MYDQIRIRSDREFLNLAGIWHRFFGQSCELPLVYRLTDKRYQKSFNGKPFDLDDLDKIVVDPESIRPARSKIQYFS